MLLPRNAREVGELLLEPPDLERDDLRACLAFAAESLRSRGQHVVLT